MDPLRTPPPSSDGAAGAVDARSAEARQDLRQRDIVNDALCLMQAVGTLSALEYLKSHAVEARVIARVLLEPSRRRSLQRLEAA